VLYGTHYQQVDCPTLSQSSRRDLIPSPYTSQSLVCGIFSKHRTCYLVPTQKVLPSPAQLELPVKSTIDATCPDLVLRYGSSRSCNHLYFIDAVTCFDFRCFSCVLIICYLYFSVPIILTCCFVFVFSCLLKVVFSETSWVENSVNPWP
jgi:hypothetical protein